MNKKIIMLTGRGESATYMYNGLKEAIPIAKVIIEKGTSKKLFVERRIKRLGWLKVSGQILFQLVIYKFIRLRSWGRINEIKAEYNLNDSPIPEQLQFRVNSVNSAQCKAFIEQENPDLIIVSGTRIIAKRILNCTDAIFLNTHAGITPRYRGVHGGYWALANEDRDNCGVTVHVVDSGIDTGGILIQKNIKPTSADNFSTYPFLQIGAGINMMKIAINNFVDGKLKTIQPRMKDSILWYHPTMWQYFYNRWFKGVK